MASVAFGRSSGLASFVTELSVKHSRRYFNNININININILNEGFRRYRWRLLCVAQSQLQVRQQQRKLMGEGEEAEEAEHGVLLSSPLLMDVQEAVTQLLCESGVSMDDAITISSRAPKYNQMLADTVQELDNSNLWNLWQQEEVSECQIVNFAFKEKVLEVARRKDANGIAPYLESLGVKYSSVLYLSRYFSTETLISLSTKINYLKNILEPCNYGTIDIGSKVQRMMMRLSISVDDDLQKTLSFFEKIEAQRGGLATLNSGTEIIARLIESFPKLFLLSVENHVKPVADFLEGVGVPGHLVGMVFLCFPPVFLYDIDGDIRPRLRTLNKIGICKKNIGNMLVRYPWLLSRCILENTRVVINFFDEANVPRIKVKRALAGCPQLSGSSTMKLKVMLDEINSLVESTSVTRVFSSSPRLFLRRPPDFNKVVMFLRKLGLDSNSIGKVLRRCPEIFATDIQSTMNRKLAFLLDLGISTECVRRVVEKYPDVLVRGVDQSLKPRIEYLEKVGFSKAQISFMIKAFPPLLGYSVNVLERKMDFLIDVMEKPIDEVVAYPRYFSYSLENRIKPRFRVLKRLKFQCDLKTMLSRNDEEFAERFLGVSRMLVPPVEDM